MMNNGSCRCEFGGNGKRRRVEEDTNTNTDRLSCLPESIIHHILSFLDTKSAVHTSVLSRLWRCAWKHVHVLDFRRGSFQRYSSFQRYVENVLSSRYPFNISKVSFTSSDDVDEEEEDDDEEREFSLLVNLIKYALSHDVQHLVINPPDTLNIDERYRFSDLFGTTLNCNLKVLELGGFYIGSGFGSSGFPMLTTLCLENCELVSDEDVDLFATFPQLKNLVLNRCIHLQLHRRSLKISAPKLISLKLLCLFRLKVKIVAPKLKFFGLQYHGPCLEFSELSLPSLDHADIWVDLHPGVIIYDSDGLQRHWIFLFKALHNAKSLTLHSVTIKAMSDLPGFLEQLPSPFTRLKRLNLHSNNIPYKLVKYFLEGSISTEPTIKLVGT